MRYLYLFLLTQAVYSAEPQARNVILFLGDAGGIPTLNAASIHGHGAPRKLFIQNMPNIGLSETSAADGWVTDSAAGMTAIVTGQKTNNGVLSLSASTVRGKSDGEQLKTILEYAEEKGLSTGVISNMPMADATPAACFAHVNDRSKYAEIFAQILNPRFGDGVDLVIGGGRKQIYAATEKAGIDLDKGLQTRGYALYDKPSAIQSTDRRVIALFDAKFDPAPVVRQAIEILSKNPKGYFLMVEWDMHTVNIKQGLDNALTMDSLILQTARQVDAKDTLLLYTADHSFDLRLRGGKTGKPILSDDPAAPNKALRMEDGHTGEEVLVAAQGPGADRVRGYMANTDLFGVMMSAYGWQPSLTFLHTSDTHVSNLEGVHPRLQQMRGSNKMAAAHLREFFAQTVVAQKADFAVATGDLIDAYCFDAPQPGKEIFGQIDLFAGIVKNSPVPFYPTPGNHDIECYRQKEGEAAPIGDQSVQAAARQLWKEKLPAFAGGTYYSFRKQVGKTGFLFFALDNGEQSAQRNAAYRATQMAWIKSEVEKHPSDYLIFMMHIPPTQSRFNEALSAVADPKRTVLILAGHNHQNGLEQIPFGPRQVQQVRTASLGSDTKSWRALRLFEDRIEVTEPANPEKLMTIVRLSNY